MKKFITYILILITSLIVFGSAESAYAQSPQIPESRQGMCTWIYNNGGGVQNTTRNWATTYSECAANARFGGISISWAQCIFIGVDGEAHSVNNSFTKESCESLPGTYTSYQIYPVSDQEQAQGQEPVGYCTVSSGQVYRITESVCTNFHHGTWSTIDPNSFPATTTTAGSTNTNPNYKLLVPLPNPDNQADPLTNINVAEPSAFSKYLNLMIKIFIGICAVLSVIMIVIGGLEYMTSELISSKESGKQRITQAILGLLIALGAFALLNTIDPTLLKSDLNPNIQNANIVTPPDLSPITTGEYCFDETGTLNAEITTRENCLSQPGYKWLPPAN